MIPRGKGAKSYESREGKRVDGKFVPIRDKYGMVIDYKYNHVRCWFCGNETTRTKENGLHVCDRCQTITNHIPDLTNIKSKRKSKRAMRRFIYKQIHKKD